MTTELLNNAILKLRDAEENSKTWRQDLETLETKLRSFKELSKQTREKLQSSKKEFTRVANRYGKTLDRLKESQVLAETLKDLKTLLHTKTIEANKRILLSREISNERHILQ